MMGRSAAGIASATTVSLIAFCLFMLPVSADTNKLQYDVFVEEFKVGKIFIDYTLQNNEYRIDGIARSVGLLELLIEWRGSFQATGLLQPSGPTLLSYHRRETRRNRSLDIVYSDGQIQKYVRNGKERPAFKPPAQLDLFSSLLLLPHCPPELDVHDGKDLWRLTKIESASESPTEIAGATHRCQFTVVDEDGVQSDLFIWVAPVNGLYVPLKAVFDGEFSASVELVHRNQHP